MCALGDVTHGTPDNVPVVTDAPPSEQKDGHESENQVKGRQPGRGLHAGETDRDGVETTRDRGSLCPVQR